MDHVDPPSGIRYFDLFAVNGCLDDEGRLFGEHRAELEGFAGPPTERVRCPYEGSRRQNDKPMNMSAWRQIANHWDELLDNLELLRRRYLARRAPAFPMLPMWQLSTHTTALPSYLLHRTFAPVASGELPASVAALYKTLIGMQFVATVHCFVNVVVQDKRLAELEADVPAIIATCERLGMFVGKNEVCAGPPKKIAEAIAALLDGAPERPLPPSLLLDRLVTDWDQYFAFVAQVSALYYAQIAFLEPEARILRELDIEMGREMSTLTPFDGAVMKMGVTLGAHGLPWAASRHPPAVEAPYLALIASLCGHEAGPFTVDEAEIDATAERLLALRPDAADDAARRRCRLLARHIRLERTAIVELSAIEERLNHLLGRDRPTRPLDGDALVACYGDALKKGFEGSLGVALEVGPAATVVRFGGRSLTVA